MISVQLPAGATKERTDKTLEKLEKFVLSYEEVKDVITISGFSFFGSGQNMAMGFVILKDWHERPSIKSDAVILSQIMMGQLMSKGVVEDGMAIAANPPPIRELGNGGIEFYLQDRSTGGSHEALLAKRNELIAKIRKNPMFSPRDTRAAGLELSLIHI